MIHLFNQKNKTIFIEGEESMLKDLPPELAKWGIKAVKNLPDNGNVHKIILEPLIDPKPIQLNRDNDNRVSVICDDAEGVESSNTIKIKLKGAYSKKIPELCKTVRRVCELV